VEQGCSFVKPLQIGFETTSPCVAICLVLNDAGFFCKRERFIAGRAGVIRHRRGEREIRAGVEGWIDVDKVHLARELRKQRGKHVFLVAPDQPVAPFLLAEPRPILQTELTVLRRLVDGLDRLKGQRHAQGRDPPSGGIVLPFPN
jgi:hypothetical protein